VHRQDLSPAPLPRSRNFRAPASSSLSCSLPLLNPWVRGDGVGLLRLCRAPPDSAQFDFTEDYRHANESFRGRASTKMVSLSRLSHAHRPSRQPTSPSPRHSLDSVSSPYHAAFFSPALWVPPSPRRFFHSLRLNLALATPSRFSRLATRFPSRTPIRHERWALLATIAIWWASSLAVYMYFNPSGRTRIRFRRRSLPLVLA